MDQNSLAQLTVVIADDNAFIRQIARSVLNGFGIRKLVECKDGFETVEACERFRPHVVLIDAGLTGLDGFEVTRMIRRASDGLEYTPIVLLSAVATRDLVFRALMAGAHEFVTKPFSPATLHARIVNLSQRPRPFMRTQTYFGPVPNSKEILERLGGSSHSAAKVDTGTQFVEL